MLENLFAKNTQVMSCHNSWFYCIIINYRCTIINCRLSWVWDDEIFQKTRKSHIQKNEYLSDIICLVLLLNSWLLGHKKIFLYQDLQYVSNVSEFSILLQLVSSLLEVRNLLDLISFFLLSSYWRGFVMILYHNSVILIMSCATSV